MKKDAMTQISKFQNKTTTTGSLKQSTCTNMQEAFLDVCGVPTHVMTWGGWVEESLEDGKEIVLCIPGNPGLPGYYTTFLSEVHSQIGKDVPVWIIGHAGHNDPAPTSLRTVPDLVGNEGLYDLKGQIEHKKAFIEKYIPEGVKIHLVGHSIGCYMILELLKDPTVKRRVKYNYMLFPTIEKMADTRNGKYLMNVVRRVHLLLHFILILFCFLPITVRSILIYLYFIVSGIPKHFIGTTVNYMTTSVMSQSYFLALDEMHSVQKLDVDSLKENGDKMKLYYGANDNWAPATYYHALKKQLPEINAELCCQNIEHAFVLWAPQKMGTILAGWIIQNRNVN